MLPSALIPDTCLESRQGRIQWIPSLAGRSPFDHSFIHLYSTLSSLKPKPKHQNTHFHNKSTPSSFFLPDYNIRPCVAGHPPWRDKSQVFHLCSYPSFAYRSAIIYHHLICIHCLPVPIWKPFYLKITILSPPRHRAGGEPSFCDISDFKCHCSNTGLLSITVFVKWVFKVKDLTVKSPAAR